MYINFWYPVCIAAELGASKPLRTMILGLHFVAFRDAAGQAQVLADTCCHRGGSLGKGKLAGGHVVCPYHGWEFDGSGRCKKIPSLKGEQKIPSRAKVDSYPVKEQYGIIFAFLGDLPEEERIPFYEIPQWQQQGWRASGLICFTLNTSYERSIENGLDPVHNEFVHDLQGNIRFRADRMQVTTDVWSSEVYIRMDPPKPGTTQLENLRNDDQPEDFGATSSHYGPNTLITTINLSKDNSFIQYFFEQPVDANHTRIFFINLRNCMLSEEHDARIQEINMAIANEDVRVVEELHPVRSPKRSQRELLVVGDESIVEYRAHLQEWQRRGWRIDSKSLQQNDGDVAYAIPSPARRTEKNWVVDPVPLVIDAATSDAATDLPTTVFSAKEHAQP